MAKTWPPRYRRPPCPQEMLPGDQGLLAGSLAALQNPPQHGAPGSLPPRSREDCESLICPGCGLTPLTAEKVKRLLKENGLQVASPTMLPDMALAGNGEKSQLFYGNEKGVVESLQHRRHWA